MTYPDIFFIQLDIFRSLSLNTLIEIFDSDQQRGKYGFQESLETIHGIKFRL